MRIIVVALLTLVLLAGCSLAPEQPVTRAELMKTKVYNKYVIDESPEELLYALNTRGEVVVESKRPIPGGELNVYVKLLATADGLELLEYER
jgi:uncharacterized protein YcfL